MYLQKGIGEGNGTPLQYSCLESPMDGGVWQAAVHGVVKSQTRLSDFTFTFTFVHCRRKWQPTPVFLPRESQGQASLVGCHLWGRTELDTTEATQQQQQLSVKVVKNDHVENAVKQNPIEFLVDLQGSMLSKYMPLYRKPHSLFN